MSILKRIKWWVYYWRDALTGRFLARHEAEKRDPATVIRQRRSK